MKNKNKFLIPIISIFILVLSITTYISFSSNTDIQEVIIKSITPVYDSNSTVVVDNNNVVFNDKNQVVEYKVITENTQNYDVKINNITLSTPTEEFLTYEVQGIEENDILEANSTKELTIYLETTGIKGWGRNFQDELTVNISFDRVTKNEEVEPPQKEENKDEVEPPKEDIKQPEKPVASTEDLINKVDKIEIIKVTKDTIEFKETPKLEKGDKIAVWLYSDPIFLGYFEVIEKNGIKQIVGLEEALKEADIESGEHHIVLATEESETIGYVEVYVDEKQQVSEDKPTTEDDGKIENPYTNTGLIILYTTVAGVAVIGLIVLRNKKVNKYLILVIAITSTLSFVNAEEPIELSITQDVSFKSQNVMKPSGLEYDFDNDYTVSEGNDYWEYNPQIKNIYIQNEITEIDEYTEVFDVTEAQNGRVLAYLVMLDDNNICSDIWESYEHECYDLVLQADGMIYFNENASYYFAGMRHLESIENLKGIETSEATNMSHLFAFAGQNSETFTLDVSNFDTSNVTNMNEMFSGTGENNSNFTLDVSNFDTSNVTDMSSMFSGTGENNPNFTLDVSNFDTSNVTNMSSMFGGTGYNSTKLNTSITIKNSKVNYYSQMFQSTTLKQGSQIKVNYTKETDNLVVAMVGTRSEGANVEIGNCIDCDDNYIPVGTEVNINGEKFNVISKTDDTVTMLAQYNLGTNYKQTTSQNYVTFSESKGWEYTPGPKEINIQEWSTNPKMYVNAYVEYLKEELSDDSIAGNLITLKEFENSGCSIPANYGWTSNIYSKSCITSPFASWIINEQLSWTSSAYSYSGGIFALTEQGVFNAYSNTYKFGIRPTITISKDTYNKFNTLIRFKIDGKTYYAEEGMYWSEWVESKYNVDGYLLYTDTYNFRVYKNTPELYANDFFGSDSLIKNDKEYPIQHNTLLQ